MKSVLPILKTKLFVVGFVSACTIVLATTVPQIRNFIAPEKVLDEKNTAEQKKISPKKIRLNKEINASRLTSRLSFDMENGFEATLISDAAD